MTVSTTMFRDRDVRKPARSFTPGLNCLWLAPDRTAGEAPSPTILFLHGSGERGHGGPDLDCVSRWGLPKFRHAGAPLTDEPFPFLVIAPQCPLHRTWCDDDVLRSLVQLLDGAVASGMADPHRLVIAGFSMGGVGSFCLALRDPNRFAALVSVCGRCPIPAALPELAMLPSWIAYAEDDAASDLTAGSQLAIDVLAPFGHVVARAYRMGTLDGLSAHVRTADAAFAEADLYRWLAQQRQPAHPQVRS